MEKDATSESENEGAPTAIRQGSLAGAGTRVMYAKLDKPF